MKTRLLPTLAGPRFLFPFPQLHPHLLPSLFLFLLLSLSLPFSVSAAQGESPNERNARMAWWREARLGMFVHWGLYSVAAGSWNGQPFGGGAEWIQHYAGVPTEEYGARLQPFFQPRRGFAREWARLAREMGAEYVVFTGKHHDGFALWESRVSDFDARDTTGRDLFKEIIAALRAEGLRIGVYFSVIDWHHPDFPVKNSGLPHPLQKRLEKLPADPDVGRDMGRYVEFMHRQVDEITTRYGRLDILWWDWSSKETQGDSWKAPELMAAVRKAQPRIIMNNRLYFSPNVEGDNLGIFDVSKGDFTTPEQHIPAKGLPGVDWEACMTLNETWGWSRNDLAWKSTETLIRNTIDAASKGGNYLVNVGPLADGTIPEPIQVRFRELGAWMSVYGDSIKGSTAGGVEPVPWGRITAKSGRLYLHVFDWPPDHRVTLRMTPPPASVTGSMLADPRKAPIPCDITGDGVVVTLDPAFLNPYASVAVIEIGERPPGR